MSNNKSTFHILAEHLTTALQPLSYSVSNLTRFKEFMFRLGWNVESLPSSFTALTGSVNDAQLALDSLPSNPTYDQISNLLFKIKEVYIALQSITEAPDGVNKDLFLSEIRERVFEILITDYLMSQLPSLYNALKLLGIINHQFLEATDSRPSYFRTKFNFDQIKNLISDPSSLPEILYGWGSEHFDFSQIMGYIHELLQSLDFPTSIKRVSKPIGKGYQSSPDKASLPVAKMLRIPIFSILKDEKPVEASLSLLQMPAEGEKLPGIIIHPEIPPEVGQEIKLDDNLTVRIKGGMDLSSVFGFILRPGEISFRNPFQPDSKLPDTGFGITLDYLNETSAVLFGSHEGSRFEIKGAAISIIANHDQNHSEIILVIEASLNESSLIIAANEQDSFLADLIGSNELRIPVPLTVGWSNKRGFYFAGNSALAMSVNPHLSIGAIKIDKIAFIVNSSDEIDSPNFATQILIAVSGRLGPIAFSIDDIGLRFRIVFRSGNAGPFDISIDVLPPTGIGLSINENGIKGGGFISRTQNKYTGIIDLDILGYSVQALAILTTDPEISFLFALFAKLKTAIQLGAGWKLTKIGGMLGVNHTVSHDKIATGIKSGVLDKILFPDNVIENAPTIIANFETVFPALHGQNIFGPAIQIAYGTPTLITADVAVILEFPNPFLLSILGKVTSKLPNAENPIVQINIGIVGALDIVHGKVGVYGSIYDSKILDFVLSGDMAFAASWGAEKNLILSVGGFNPRFTPPSNFPPFNAPRLKRLNLAFSDLVTFECYLALTSNTLQIGARVDAVFKKSGAVISGFLSFDALVLFNPLYYIIDVEAGFGVKIKGRNLASITFVGTIEGPNPHRIKGSVTFSILWWDFSIHVEKTFGNIILDIISSIDPWPILRETLGQEESWTVETPPWQKMGVVTNEDTMLTNQEGSQLIHPTGKFKISQRVVPFNHTLTKFGSVDPKEHFRFEIVSLNDIDASHLLKTDDYFAPGQFTQFSTEEMLSLNSYELMESGIFFGSDADLEIATSFEALRSKDIEYESVLLENTANKQDIQGKPLDQLPPLSNVLSQTLVVSSRSYHTTFANDSKLKYRPNYRVSDSALKDEKFIIFDEDKNEMVGAISKGELSRSVAIDKLKEHRKANPDDKRNLNVISMFELPELPPTP